MKNDFFNTVGVVAIGSRLRALHEKINEDAAAIYEMFDIKMQPKWFPVFYTLAGGSYTVTEIAQHIGHSHPSVSRIVSEMVKAEIVVEAKVADGRRNMLSLSEKGNEINEKLKYQVEDVGKAVEDILNASRHNLWEAIDEWEFLLEQKSLLKRVQEQKKLRESSQVEIVEYEDKYQAAFKSLNEEWISTYFEMEEADYKALDNPKEYILDNGGRIFVALFEGEPAGVCALIKMNDPDYDYELAKMAVSPKAQGKSIGYMLGQVAVKAAKEAGARKLYLESNTILKPAINLYHKLGFRKVVGHMTPYKRCNIQMELNLKE